MAETVVAGQKTGRRNGSGGGPPIGGIEAAFNQLAERNAFLTDELLRISRIIGREGRMTERARAQSMAGSPRRWRSTSRGSR